MAYLVGKYKRKAFFSKKYFPNAREKELTFKKGFAIMYAFYKKGRGVAQLVARCVRDAKVVGSNPVASTKNSG